MTDLSIVREFGTQLRGAKDPYLRRRATVAIPIVALAATGLLGIFSSGGVTERALAVSRSDDSIVIKLQHAAAGAPQLTRELRDAGVDGRIVSVPASTPGEWVAATRQGDSDSKLLPPAPNAKPLGCPDLAAAEPIRGAVVNGTTITMPADASDRDSVVLLVGREAESGETQLAAPGAVSYNGDGDAILHCSAQR